MFGTKKTNVTSTASDPQLRYANGNVIDSEWRLEKTIGKGSYGKVKQGYNLLTGQRAALKFIARSSIKKPAHWTRIRREINLLLLMRHPHVVGLWEAREQEEDIMLVMELVRGADLFERIVNHDRKHYGEGEGRRIFRQIIEAVDYCHQHRIIHRDLKPENIMIDENGQVKLIDFGFANLYHPKDKLETNCGSPLYAAPEIVQGVRYVGPEVDIWSLGVVLYAMLTGTLPFEDEQLKGLYAKICKGEYREPEHLSEGAKDLIRSMLTVEGDRRATMAQIKMHPWLCDSHRATGPLRWNHPSPPPRLTLTPTSLNESFIRRLSEDFNLGDPSAIRTQLLLEPDSHAYAIYGLMEERKREAKEHADTAHITKQLEATDLDNQMMPAPATPVKRRFTNHLDTPVRNLGWIELSNSNLHTAIEMGPTATETAASNNGMGSIISMIGNTLSNKIKSLRKVGGFGDSNRITPATPLKTPRNMQQDWIP